MFIEFQAMLPSQNLVLKYAREVHPVMVDKIDVNKFVEIGERGFDIADDDVFVNRRFAERIVNGINGFVGYGFVDSSRHFRCGC